MSGFEASNSTSQSDGRKRANEDASKQTQRVNPLTKQEKQHVQLKELTAQLQRVLARLKSYFEMFQLVDGHTNVAINLTLPNMCTTLQEHQPNVRTLALLQDSIPFLEGDPTFKHLDPRKKNSYRVAVENVNTILEKIANIYKELLEDEAYAPSAGSYTDPTVWPKWQAKEAAILNLRPSTNQGLPLCTFHPIFARFRTTVQQQPSDATALQVAHNLCIRMTESFPLEKLRRDAFKDCVQPLFDKYYFGYEVRIESSLEGHSSKAGLVLFRGTREILMGVYKVECGTGDANMQVSRIYQTWINRLRGNKANELAHGAPLMLLCIMGPLLIVAGGFFDGKSVLVEPLVQPCFMLPDYSHEWQSQLASVLLAAKGAVDSLSQFDYSVGVAFKPGLPRIYPSFTSFDGTTIALTFESRLVLNEDPNHDLLFLATRSDSLQQVLVKLVTEHDQQYGVDVHCKLADAGHAPVLFGVVKVEGAHTAYVMEYLCSEDGWITLDEYANNNYQDIISRIEAPVDRILKTMESEEVVHGDLRPNNIMVREVEGKLEMKLVDFDWAGASGKVRYPFHRNENILWPAGAGESIVTGHDRQLLMACLGKQVKKLVAAAEGREEDP